MTAASHGDDDGGGMAPAATVVIPTFNSTPTLPRALASVDDDTAELLVIDDASDDADELLRIAGRDPRVTVLRKPERSNAAHSRALGLARARADLVLFLDSDDSFTPGHVARRRALHRAAQAGVAIGRFRLDDGARQWDWPMADYRGEDIEDYLFAGGGDARSSTISVYRPAARGTTFDPRMAKHQDWGFALAAWRNGERIAFDPVPGAVISLAGAGRMSARSNVEASLSFAREQLRHDANRRRFLLARLRTSLRLDDIAAAGRFRRALLELSPRASERWGSAAMIAAARIGVAAPIHRLLAARR